VNKLYIAPRISAAIISTFKTAFLAPALNIRSAFVPVVSTVHNMFVLCSVYQPANGAISD
jgi:hypothetical protein